MKKNFITARLSSFNNKTIASAELTMKSGKTTTFSLDKLNTIIAQKEKQNTGSVEISKQYTDQTDSKKNRDAKIIKWIQSDNDIVFELYILNTEGKWKFTDESILTNAQLEAFIPIANYYSDILEQIKLAEEKAKLVEPDFLSRNEDEDENPYLDKQ